MLLYTHIIYTHNYYNYNYNYNTKLRLKSFRKMHNVTKMQVTKIMMYSVNI